MPDDIPVSESTPPVIATPTQVDPQSKEAWFGGVVVLVICLLLLVLTGTFGYFGYRLWKTSQVEQTTPSIQELSEHMAPRPAESKPETPPSTSTTPSSPTTPVQTTSIDKTAIEVKVLNGGATKGSASTLTELLKKAGFTKATFGNSVTDHTGTMIYYGNNSQATAEMIKETVVKTYPKATLSPAQTGDKDATSALVVVILGK